MWPIFVFLVAIFTFVNAGYAYNDDNIKSPSEINNFGQTNGAELIEHWPETRPIMTEKIRSKILEYQQKYVEIGYNPDFREAYNYNSNKHYFGYGMYGHSCQEYEVPGVKELNQNGVMMIKFSGIFYTDPVLSAQCGMQLYFFENRKLTKIVDAYIDDILASQDTSGAIRYSYPLNYKSIKLLAGFADGMTQGQVLSFFSRILQDYDRPDLYAAAEKAMEFLVTPIENGGVMSTMEDLDPSLSSYIMFEEVVAPENLVQPHILNGFIFALIGLYDWWQLHPEDQQGSHYLAKVYFNKGIKTLEKILPYYDANGFSLYDIFHLTDSKQSYHLATPAYHYTHLYLLQAIYGLTHNQVVGQILKRWSADVGYYRDYNDGTVASDYTISLAVGWNLVGTRTTINVPHIFGDSASFTSLWKWETDKWAIWLPSDEDGGVSYATSKGFVLLKSIAPGEGFWVASKQVKDIILTSTPVADGPLTLVKGWNLVSLKSGTAKDVGSLVNETTASMFSFWKWVNGTWAVYLPGEAIPGAYAKSNKGFSVLATINPGEGFWVDVQ